MKKRNAWMMLALAACGGGGQANDPTTAPTTTTNVASSAAPSATDTAKPTPSASASTAPPAPTAVVKYTGFQTPESVLFDEPNDRYLVSNINGKPTDVDNNGYISELSPDGKITKEKWIAGGQNKVTLNAPKGSGIVNGVFYVTDIDTVRMFDAKTGAPKGDIKIAGATFLNDLAIGPDGKVYVSDSGLNAKFEASGTDAVWVIDKGKATALIKDKDLGKPNGLLVSDKGIWVVTFGSGEIYRIDDKGKKQDAAKLPKGQLDGIVMAGESLLVSSWEASSIYKGKPGGTFDVAFTNLKSPADIGWDKKRSRVLVPLFVENTVEVYEVK